MCLRLPSGTLASPGVPLLGPALFQRALTVDRCSTDPVQEALLDERRKLEVAIQQELKGKGPAMGGAALSASSAEASASGADAQEGGVDALDAFMSDMQHQIEEDKVRLGLTSTVSLSTLHQHHNAEHIGRVAEGESSYAVCV